jgi:ring-1,2-phenylacetyl-CoA epoxidase subunit PaaD
MTTRQEILERLAQVQDPEVPVLNVVEMGIVRDVEISSDGVRVLITPTYSGCPAMHAIEQRIVAALEGKGYGDISVKTTLAEAWTTDWMTDEARQKLNDYGIAPPQRGAQSSGGPPASVGCPFCDSANTELRAEFGSTACKALYFCSECRQPFEHFKCL